MRRSLRWVVHGRRRERPEPVVLLGEWSNPREEAIIAAAAALEAQTAMMGTQALLLERFAVAAEQVVAALERQEARAVAAAEQRELEAAP